MPPKKKKVTTPSPPTDIKIDGKDASAEMITKSMTGVTISAKIDDPTAGQEVKLKIQYSSNDFKPGSVKTLSSDYGKQARRAHIRMPNLKTDTLYKVRLWTLGKKAGDDQVSKQYTSASFWMNRSPTVELVTPSENTEYHESQTILFDWKFLDDDEPSGADQSAYRIRYKPEGGPWEYIPRKDPQTGKEGKDTFLRFPATALVANTNYLWSVRARDHQGLWSEWPLAVSFFVRGDQSPPTLLAPVGGVGTSVIVGGDETVRFTWKFRDPDPKNKQTQADIRWRVVGTDDVGFSLDEGWVTQFGTGITPGEVMQWDIDGGYFQPGFIYEWQVRTYDDKSGGLASGWSQSAKFVSAIRPGSANVDPPLSELSDPRSELGCGHHRVFIYDRGGMVLRGEIKPLQRVQWGRKRDDIANCLINTNGFDQDCCELLGNLQSWAHEVVIFRDGERVFEGPITRLTYTSESVEIEAKDVMAYVYRRVMRQGYNDAYRRIDLTPKTPPKPVGKPGGGPYTILGAGSVVDRALQITLDALAYRDPNVLQYVTALQYPDDAPLSRIVADYSRSAWEEIDDLAATAGLDYTTIGRRIVYWDTHRTIGRLPEMRDGDFSDPVIVTEYGMQFSNWYAVTNNNGVAGIAYPAHHDQSNWAEDYGPVEMVSSAYGEQEGGAVSTRALTPGQRDALVQSFTKQAQRGISNRWPIPVVVRVPDNSTLNPQVNLGINQLVPGVWIPLRATLTCRKLAQWQKLDSVDVEEVEGQEFVRVTMSPAPHGGDDDPDLSGDVDAS